MQAILAVILRAFSEKRIICVALANDRKLEAIYWKSELARDRRGSPPLELVPVPCPSPSSHISPSLFKNNTVSAFAIVSWHFLSPSPPFFSHRHLSHDDGEDSLRVS